MACFHSFSLSNKILILLGIFFVLLGYGWLVIYWTYTIKLNNGLSCATNVERLEVRGSSLAPLINPGQTIKLLHGYYNCQPVNREDVIAYKYAGHLAPIIKIVKAIPGDKWRLEQGEKNDAYQILVNDQAIKNSLGQKYQIPESKIKMLELYSKNYPVIPQNTYLLLGNQAAGSLDATQFGLIDKADIMGKVELK